MSNANPSLDPADNNSLAGAMAFAMKKAMQQSNGMLPARVIKYDRSANRVQVQILINQVATDNTQIPRPQLASIPVFVFGGGGFRLSFPLKPGDLGWVKANDRDISGFLQSYSQTAPNTPRLSSFSDGVFFPDVMTGLDTIAGADAEKAVLQNADGSVTISIGSDSLDIKTTTTVSITATTSVNVITPVLAVTGNITATGTITPGV